jgi:O-antigen/teichoic acid export membrane protein
VRAVDVRAAIARYRQFPLFNVPYSLVGSFSREVPVFLLTAVGMTASGGAYGLARSVVLAPVTVLSASLSQVFFKEAVDLIHTERLANLAGNVMLAIAMVFTVPFVMLGIFGPELFAAVFGDEWRKAGAFAAILAPVAYLFLYSSWPERLFEVAGAQHVALGVQLLGDLLSILAALAVLRMTGADLPTIGAFAAVSCAYHVVYLATAFRVARIPAAILLRPLQMAITLALTSAMLFSLIRLNLQPRTAIVIALLVSLGGAGWGALRVFRQRLAWFS